MIQQIVICDVLWSAMVKNKYNSTCQAHKKVSKAGVLKICLLEMPSFQISLIIVASWHWINGVHILAKVIIRLVDIPHSSCKTILTFTGFKH